MVGFKILCAAIIGAALVVPARADLAVDLDTIVVTNSRIEQKDYKVASNVTVIDRKRIEASNSQSIPDLLREIPGIHIYDNSTNKTAIIDIRGFGDSASRNVLVLINGRKVNAIDVSGPDLEQLSLDAVERIEIIRGGASVLYGDNAVGGVVNIITKKGQGDLIGKVGYSYGSYNASAEYLEVSGSLKGFSYYLHSKYADHKGYRVNSDELSRDFNLRLGYDLKDNVAADLEVGWHKDDSGLPGGLSDADLARLGRRGSSNLDDFSSTKDRYVKLALDVSPWYKEINWGDLRVDLLYRNRDSFDAFNTFGPFHTKRSIDTSGVTAKYVFDQTVFGKEVNFVTGVDYYDHTNDIIGFGDNDDNITISKVELGIYEYLQYEMVHDLFVNFGTRYNRSDYEFNQRNVVVNAKQSPEKWVNMGGLKYEYAKGSNVHFNWQQTFRFLATDEWYSTANFPGFGITPGLNLDLRHQSGEQYDWGIRHNWNNVAIWDLTPYLMVNQHEIFFDPVTFGNSNYGKTRRVGLEFSQRVDLLKVFNIPVLDKLELITGYTYQDARFDKGANDGKTIPMVPQHEASQALVIRLYQDFEVTLTQKYVGARYAVNDVQNATDLIKPYHVLDGKIAYSKDHWEVFAAVNNIFNEKYSSYVSKSTVSAAKSYFPSPERNVTIGVDVKF